MLTTMCLFLAGNCLIGVGLAIVAISRATDRAEATRAAFAALVFGILAGLMLWGAATSR